MPTISETPAAQRMLKTLDFLYQSHWFAGKPHRDEFNFLFGEDEEVFTEFALRMLLRECRHAGLPETTAFSVFWFWRYGQFSIEAKECDCNCAGSAMMYAAYKVGKRHRRKCST